MAKLANRLLPAARKVVGKRLVDVAAESGCSTSYLHRVEVGGSYKLTVAKARAIARAVNLDPEILFGFDYGEAGR